MQCYLTTLPVLSNLIIVAYSSWSPAAEEGWVLWEPDDGKRSRKEPGYTYSTRSSSAYNMASLAITFKLGVTFLAAGYVKQMNEPVLEHQKLQR